METISPPKLIMNMELTEAYRRLRTHILFYNSEMKAIAFTSCFPGEGKSDVSLRLALCMAQTGENVFYIDADLRRSLMMHCFNDAKIQYGLSEYLSGQQPLDKVVFSVEGQKLDIICAGRYPPNSSELLGSELFGKLIKNLKEKYDYVFIDTPPIKNVIDGAIAACHCDGIVLVVEDNKIGKETIVSVKAELEKTGASLLGIVLNKTGFRKHSRYRKYYKHYGTWSFRGTHITLKNI